jgi:hypothetical protein
LRYLWLALFVLFVGIASFFAEELFFPIRPPFSAQSPEAVIYQDFKELEVQKALPPELKKISEIFFSDHRLQKTDIKWLELSRFYFPRKSQGNFELQIEAFDAPSDGSKDASTISIFQFSLFDKNSKNKIWELSRNYTFPGPTRSSSR